MDPGLIKLLEDDEEDHTQAVSGAAVDAMAESLGKDMLGEETSLVNVDPQESETPQTHVKGTVSGMQQHCQEPPSSLGKSQQKPQENHAAGVHFRQLLSFLQPAVSSEQWQELTNLYERMKNGGVPRSEFIRGAKDIVGAPIMAKACGQLQQQQHHQRQQNLPQQTQLQHNNQKQIADGSQSSSSSGSLLDQLQMQQNQESPVQPKQDDAQEQQTVSQSQEDIMGQEQDLSQDKSSHEPEKEDSKKEASQAFTISQSKSVQQNFTVPANFQLQHSRQTEQLVNLSSSATVLQRVKQEVDKTFVIQDGEKPMNQLQQNQQNVSAVSSQMQGQWSGPLHGIQASSLLTSSTEAAINLAKQKAKKEKEEDRLKGFHMLAGQAYSLEQQLAASLHQHHLAGAGKSAPPTKQEAGEQSTGGIPWSPKSHVHTITHDASSEDVPKSIGQEYVHVSERKQVSSFSSKDWSSQDPSAVIPSLQEVSLPTLGNVRYGMKDLGGPPANTAASAVFQSDSLSASLASLNAVLQTPHKPTVAVKKPADTLASPQPPSKKMKMLGADLEQGIDQLNDVTAVSGVNLKEEEEQLLAGSRVESRTNEAIRRVVLEEEDRFFLEKNALHAKVSAIAAKSGIKTINEDAERCLSMSVEELLWKMMYKLVKLSKQRLDIERDKHKILLISDTRKQVALMKREASELVQKRLAEENERLQRLNEAKDKSSMSDTGKESATKGQQDEDKLRTNAANIVTRAAVGADDMLLKWQIMAEQGRQKRESGDGVAGVNSSKNQEQRIMKVPTSTGRPDIDSGGIGGSTIHKFAAGGAQTPLRGLIRRPISQAGKPSRNITLKDVIAYLELDPQMSKSSLLPRLYDRDCKVNLVSLNPNQTLAK